MDVLRSFAAYLSDNFYFRELTHQHHHHIHYIGAGITGDDMSACMLEEVVGNEAGEMVGSIDVLLPCIREGVTVHHCACRIGGAVVAVGAGTEDGDIFQVGNLCGQPECQLLIAAAKAIVRNF